MTFLGGSWAKVPGRLKISMEKRPHGYDMAADLETSPVSVDN